MVLACFGNCLLTRAITNASGDRKRFLTAAEHGNDQVAAATLASRPDLITCTTLLHRKTALHLSAEHGHVAVMASVLEMMAESASLDTKDPTGVSTSQLVASVINSRDSEGRTPLIMACANNQVECARLLLANGAWRSQVDDRGNSALHYASTRGYLGIMLLLLTEFLDELKEEQLQQQAAMQQAMAMTAPGVVDVYSYGGSQAGRAVAGSRQNQRAAGGGRVSPADLVPLGVTLPGIPVERSSTLPDVVKLVNVSNWAGFTPLHLAVWAKQSGAVQVLLQHGADLIPRTQHVGGSEANIPCPGESTPLHLAAMRGHIEISRILLKTFYERVLEPMQLQASTVSAGSDREVLARVLTGLDPRTQTNCMGLIPSKVAQRMGFLQLATLLRPQIPLGRLFSEEEHRTRFYGPPALKLLAAEALNRKLLARLSAAMAQVAAEAAVVTERSNATVAATTATTEAGGSSFVSTLDPSSASDMTPPAANHVRLAESAPLLGAANAVHEPSFEGPVVSAVSTPAPPNATARQEAARKPHMHSAESGTGEPSSSSHNQQHQPQQGTALQSWPSRGMSMTGDQLLPTVCEGEEEERNSGSHTGGRHARRDGEKLAAGQCQQAASPATAHAVLHELTSQGLVVHTEQAAAEGPLSSSSQVSGDALLCTAADLAISPSQTSTPFAAVTAEDGQLIFAGTGPSFASSSGNRSQFPATLSVAAAGTADSSLTSSCFQVPVEIPPRVPDSTAAAASAASSFDAHAAGLRTPPNSVGSASGRQSASGTSMFNNPAPLSRFATDGGAARVPQAAHPGSAAGLMSPRSMTAAAMERVPGLSSPQLQPVPVSSTGSRVFALQRGSSITLVGASSGAMPAVNEAIAPYMALDNLADLVEDTASAVPRGSLVCWSRPRLDGPDDDEGDALWSPHPFTNTPGQEEGDQPPATSSRAYGSPGMGPNAPPSSPVTITPSLQRQGAVGSVSARTSASGAASSLRAAVVRSLSMSGLRRSLSNHGGATTGGSPTPSSPLNMTGCLPGLASSTTQQQAEGGISLSSVDPEHVRTAAARAISDSPTGSMVVATLTATETAAVTTDVIPSSPVLHLQPVAGTDTCAEPASPQRPPSLVPLIAPTEAALGCAEVHTSAQPPAATAPAPAQAAALPIPDPTAPPAVDRGAAEAVSVPQLNNAPSLEHPAAVLPQLRQSAAVAALMALGMDDDDDDDKECGVCMEYPAVLLVQPCQHNICGPCARKMCTLNAQRTPHCPFCRAIICDFQPNMELAGKHVPMQ